MPEPPSSHTSVLQSALRFDADGRIAEANAGPTPSGPAGEFPIVGIGASAGGLEALEQFLGGVPAGSGMAFVVVQHLDPTYKGMLPELLQRITPMPVVQITDNLAVRPDTVYVIPPNHDLSLLRRTLYLLEPHAPRGLRLPIDFFFRSLAADLQEQGIGVVLSGMGSDGTLGLRAIKEKAGLALVQDPSSAKFDGMPQSAIATGLADIVAPAEQLPGRILAFVRHLPLVPTPGPAAGGAAPCASDFDRVVILLRDRTGHDFSLYKKTTINRRIERRMAIHQLDRIADYVRLLQENPAELDLLFRELLIGVTSFFRDPAVWETLAERVVPEMIAAAPDGAVLRAWVAGCSTGEEAYSLAIVFREALAGASPPKRCTLQCYATDLDRDAIDRARAGRYPETIAADVSEERLNRFFVRDEKGYIVSKEVREMVVFAPQDLLADPPFTRLDLLSLPEPADLPGAGGPAAARPPLPLRAEPRGRARARHGRVRRRLHGPLRPGRPQAPALPADRGLRGGGARVPRRVLHSRCRPGRHGPRAEAGRQPPGAGRPGDPAGVRAGGRADHRDRRHPLHQRPDGPVPRAGGG